MSQARFRARGRRPDPAAWWSTRGSGFRLENFPLGTRVVYPPESIPSVPDVDEAIQHALLQPARLRAAARAAQAPGCG